ncbi:MAG: hypothetical protein AAGL24_18270 [Pseudomonadota bacterium]
MVHWASEKRHMSSTAYLVSGAKPVTGRAWRSNNGLFDEDRTEGKWQFFSVVDICVLRLVVVLTERGLSAQRACDVAMRMCVKFRDMLESELMPPVLYLVSYGPNDTRDDIAVKFVDPEQIDAASIEGDLSGLQLAIRLDSIFMFVTSGLRELDPPTIVPANEALRRAMRKQFGDLGKPSDDE